MNNKNNYLQLENITKQYDDGYIAIKDININVRKGDFVTLLGPSGCGKTTILKIIAGFEQATGGRVIVDGLDIKDLPINQRPTATVFQDYALFPNMNVYENIAYGLKAMRKSLKEVSQKIKDESYEIYRTAAKKAHMIINKLEPKQMRLLKSINKIEFKYNISSELFNIKNMRHAQYVMKLNYFLKKQREKLGENYQFKISLTNRWLEFTNLIKKTFFNYNKPVQYTIPKNATKYEKLFYELRRWYLFKKPLDKKIDHLRNQYNDLDQWRSYWQNYPEVESEKFKKRNISRKLKEEEINYRVENMIELVGLVGNEHKMPNELSGGMQQRVALARALVVEPDILLLDEPLSALDAKVRKQMQVELKRLHQELGLTFILVTHDQEEALALSNRVVVMSKGRIEQVDSPKKIYDAPKNEWVASFIGKTNIFNGTYIGKNKLTFAGEIFKINIDSTKKIPLNTDIKFMIRPEDINIVLPEKGFIKVRVAQVLYKGQMYEVRCLWKKNEIFIETLQNVKSGELIGLKWDINCIHTIVDKKKQNPNEMKI